jgi:hypothetical protein
MLSHLQDPLLTKPQDYCEDPTVVRDEVMRYGNIPIARFGFLLPRLTVTNPCDGRSRLNRDVVKGFIKLVQDLVHRPADNKYVDVRMFHIIKVFLRSLVHLRSTFP